MATYREMISELDGALKARKLSDKDTDFACSLMNQFKRKGDLSDKQWPWVQKLVDKANGVPQPITRPVEQVAPALKIIEIFDKAAQHLQFPRITIHSEQLGDIRFHRAGERGKHPGTVTVLNKTTDTWEGRIHLDGRFEHRENTDKGLIMLVAAFAENPAEVAAQHGKMTGSCCFCNRTLSDAPSLKVGYGKVCAGHYNLPWGAK